MEKEKKIGKVYKVYIIADFVTCPYCNSRQDGWMKDPRGLIEPCDYCGMNYMVSKDAELVFL